MALKRDLGHAFSATTPVDADSLRSALIVIVDIAGVAKYRLVVFSQEFGQLSDIDHIRRPDRDRMAKTAIDIRADMYIHSEVPPIALLGLMHLEI